MTKPIGRPKSQDPQEKRITVRVNAETLKRLEKWCKTNGKTLSEALRYGIDLVLDK